MNIVTIIVLACFILYSIIHLTFCFKENEKLRKYSKPFCLMFLVVAALSQMIYLKDPIYALVATGALLGSIGDIFLIKKHNQLWFILGTIAFILGHFCYLGFTMIVFNELNIEVPLYIVIIVAVGLVTLVIGLYPFTRKLAGRAALLGNFYMPFLLVMLVVGIALSVFIKSWAAILLPVGYLLFLCSDSFLIYTTFIKDKKRRDFYIMLTYLLAELLIVVSLLNVLLG